MTDWPDGRRSRRAFVGGLAATAGALAGCTTGTAGRDTGSRGRSATRRRNGTGAEAVSILAAGSLQLALSRGLADDVAVPLDVEAHGSTTIARLVAAGDRDPDVVSVADTALFDSVLRPEWYVTFASNAVVVAYNPQTNGGQRVAAAGPAGWYEPLLDGDVDLGRTDPDRDPLGYRTLFALELAARYYDDAPALGREVPDQSQIYPETSLLSRFETGSLDAAVVYRNMAEERGYDYVELPGEVDLSDPSHVDDWYSTVSYDLPDGTTIGGDLVSYGATCYRLDDPVRDVFEAHTTGSYLEEHGYLVPDEFPRYEGDVPDAVG